MVASTDQTPRASLTIQGMEFSYPTPYKPGPYELSEGEASTLNQVLGENLRNNFAAKIKAKKEQLVEAYRKQNGLGEDAPVEIGNDALDKNELDTEFAQYAADYEFGVRAQGTGPRVPVDPIEREAFNMAKTVIRNALKDKNIKISSVTDEQMEGLIKSLLDRQPQIREEAKRRVDATSSMAAGDLLSALTAK